MYYCFSPIDPQETQYCVVASHRRNYTSLCAAQTDVKINRFEKTNRLIENDKKIESAGKIDDRFTNDRFIEFDRSKNDRLDASDSSTEVDNKIDLDTDFNVYEANFKSLFKRKKIGKSNNIIL